MTKRTILYLLFLSIIISGCGYKTITYGSGSSKYYYSAKIVKESNEKIIANQQAALITIKLVDIDTIDRQSLESEDLKLRLESVLNKYELSFNFDMLGSTYLTPGEYQLKLISEDTTANVESELTKILIKAGDNKIIHLGVSKTVVFIDGYTIKKIRRSEWRKMKRENRK